MGSNKPHVTFVSEQAPLAATPYRAFRSLLNGGHTPILPYVRADGLIPYERGAMVLATDHYGALVMMTTTDIDDLQLEHRFIAKHDGHVFNVSAAKLKVKPHHLHLGKTCQAHDAIYLGQFIRKVNDPSGESNYSHLLGVAAWQPSPDILLFEVMMQFAQYHRNDLSKSGMLLQTSPTTWESQEVCYFAKKTKHTGYNDEPLYTLYRLLAPSKGFDARKLIHDYVINPVRVNPLNWRANLMQGWVAGLVTKHRPMALSDIQKHIEKDFSPAVKTLRGGHSLYRQTHNGKKRPLGLLRQAFARAVFALDKISAAEVGLGVIAPTALGVGLNLFSDGNEGSYVLLLPTIIVALRFAALLGIKTHTTFLQSGHRNRIAHYWAPHKKANNVPQQHEMLDPDVIKDLRILTRKEIDIYTNRPSNRSTVTPDWVELYLRGTLNGPYGSLAQVHQIGNHPVILVKEDVKNSGLTMEYWPGADIAFSRGEPSKHLPQNLCRDFNANLGKPIRMILPEKIEHGHCQTYKSVFLTEAEYQTKVTELKNAPVRPFIKNPAPFDHMMGQAFARQALPPEPDTDCEEKPSVVEIGATLIAEGFEKIIESIPKFLPRWW